MLENLRKRFGRDEEGFTLIELMVVVLIIAILLAIAIPTFLGARERANNRAAQSNIRNAMTAEKTYFADSQVYTETSATLTGVEPNLTYINAIGATFVAGNVVYVNISTTDTDTPNDTVVIGGKSASGKCYWLRDVAATGTKWADATACDAEPGTFTLDKPPA